MTPLISTLWQADVGSIHSRNSMLLADSGRKLLVSSSGREWNARDEADGLYCLDANSGKRFWFSATYSDANEIAVAGDEVLVPTDAGDIYVVDIQTGQSVGVHQVDGPAFGKPVVKEHFGSWTALVITKGGSFHRIERGGQSERIGRIHGTVRAAIAHTRGGDSIVATEEGEIYRCSFDGAEFQANLLTKVEYLGYGPGYSIDLSKNVTFAASPLVYRDRLILGYARETEFDSLPLISLSIRTGEISWRDPQLTEKENGSDKPASKQFGNIRTTPVMVGGKLVVAPAYSDSVYLLDVKSGSIDREIRLGQLVFQHWSNPVAIGNQYAVIGRVDGVCSIVDVHEGKLVASVSLATAEAEALMKTNKGRPYESNNYGLYPGDVPVGGICGTPLVISNRLFVGTTSGQVTALQLRFVDRDDRYRGRSSY